MVAITLFKYAFVTRMINLCVCVKLAFIMSLSQTCTVRVNALLGYVITVNTVVR